MQLAVVAVALPVLLGLSRLRSFAALQKCGGALAGIAALVWMCQRLPG